MVLPRFGFATRLLVLYGIIFILVLLVTDGTLSHFLQKRDLLQLQSSLSRQSTLIREIATPLLKEVPLLRSEVKKLAEETGLRITITGPEGAVLADSSETDEALAAMDNHATRPEIAAALRKETGVSVRYSMTVGTRMLYVAIPILSLTDGVPSSLSSPLELGREEGAGVLSSLSNKQKVMAVIRTAMPVTRVDEILASVRRPVMLTAGLGILIVLGAGILFSNRLTRRIRRITSVAERYAREDWSEKILIDGRDELKMLANTMNQMAATLRSRIGDLENEKGKISVILNHMEEGVIALSRHKECLIANPAAEKIFGFTATGAHRKSLIEITRHPLLERIVDHAFQDQKNVSDVIQISGKTKKTLHVHVIVLDAQARDIGGILVFHDRTELHRLENIRKEFVANVSHELRTPLTSIKGFIEILQDGSVQDPATSEKFLKIVSEETNRLGRLVEDILTLGEIEQSAALVMKEKIDLATELPSILEKFKSQLLEKKIVAENRISQGPLLLSGDKDKVHQVFVNLIDNAIKFNKREGWIILSARTIKAHSSSPRPCDSEETEGVEISVEDSGIGISEEDQSRIFERFFRVDKAHSKELGGTGLGLAIVKHILEAHGGHASCQSTPGQGSRFSVFFPV